MIDKKYQKTETKKEIENFINAGAILVSLDEYKNIFSKYGLKVCLNKKNYLMTYFNTSNSQHYLCASTTFIDEKNISFANVNGLWYKKEVTQNKRNSENYKNFKEDRNKYFTVLKSGHILSI